VLESTLDIICGIPCKEGLKQVIVLWSWRLLKDFYVVDLIKKFFIVFIQKIINCICGVGLLMYIKILGWPMYSMRRPVAMIVKLFLVVVAAIHLVNSGIINLLNIVGCRIQSLSGIMIIMIISSREVTSSLSGERHPI
jgi:hypothetical protein